MSSKQISKSAFKAKALEYFRQITSSGESVVVTDHGKPVLEVRPYRDTARQPLDVLHGSVVKYEHPTDPIAVDFWTAVQ
jgi:antitoxin (DNA-binding transcriptional repressor) of toxin-antitoxin stability system